MNTVMIALLLSTLAGLSTVIGALLAFVIKRPRKYFLPFALGLSGGVQLRKEPHSGDRGRDRNGHNGGQPVHAPLRLI